MDPIILPQAFRARLLIDVGQGEPRPLSQVAEQRQMVDFMRCDPGWLRACGMTGSEGPQRAYLERPRGASKTQDIATMCSWLLLASPRKLSGVAAAADRDQAGLLLDAISTLARLNSSWLGRMLDIQSSRVINKSTGSALDIISADVGSSFGLTPHFCVLDELHAWPREELWTSLFSSIAKRPDSMLVVITNAGTGMGESWQWKIREAARTSHDWYFSRWESPASWISQALLDEQRRLLPDIAYRRLWLNEWTAGAGDALTADAIERAVTLPGSVGAPEPGHQYFAGVDLGLSRDASAIAVIGRDVGKLVEQPRRERPVRSFFHRVADELDLHDRDTGERYVEPADDDFEQQLWLPGSGKMKLITTLVFRPLGGRKVDLSEVERALRNLHHAFKFAGVAIDPWQAELLIQRLARAGLPVSGVAFVAENLRAMAMATLDAFNENLLSLYRDDALIADLKSLRVKETGNSFRLFSVRGEGGTHHSDLAQALQLALLAAKRCEGRGPVIANNGAPLLVY